MAARRLVEMDCSSTAKQAISITGFKTTAAHAAHEGEDSRNVENLNIMYKKVGIAAWLGQGGRAYCTGGCTYQVHIPERGAR